MLDKAEQDKLLDTPRSELRDSMKSLLMDDDGAPISSSDEQRSISQILDSQLPVRPRGAALNESSQLLPGSSQDGARLNTLPRR